jgi:CRISPR-associated protein Csx3
MPTNLFPAIVLAGPPHSGKSVLSYLLTMRLREAGIDHYLVRAAPDGEGDWYLQGDFKKVQPLRLRHKGKFTDAFVRHMIKRVQNRALPLLVDVGGAPRDEQWEILRACTHAVLLYKTPEDLADWGGKLAELELLPVAEIRSDLTGVDQILRTHPVLEGTITGLDRKNYRVGFTFGAVLDRIAGICHYDEHFLETEHFRRFTRRITTSLIHERQLAYEIGAAFHGENPWWEGGDLPKALKLVPAGKEGAVYGRGPVWLAAALGVHLLPAPCWMFDTTFGWVEIPEIVHEIVREDVQDFAHAQNSNLKVQEEVLIVYGEKGRQYQAWMVDIALKDILEEPSKTFPFPPIPEGESVILSGKLPRWLFTALARKLAVTRPWGAIHIPREGKAVVIFSRIDELKIGDVLEVP